MRLKPIVGEQAEIVVESELYNEEHTFKVAWINSPGGGGVRTPMDEGEVSQFGNALRSQMSAMGRNVTARKQTVPPSRKPKPQPVNAGNGNPATDEDDIPF